MPPGGAHLGAPALSVGDEGAMLERARAGRIDLETRVVCERIERAHGLCAVTQAPVKPSGGTPHIVPA